MAKFKPTNFGFTIIELMLSITFLGLVLAIAAPGVGTFLERQRIAAQAESISSALSVARATALSEAADVQVCWNPSQVNKVVAGFTIVPGNLAVLVGDPATVIRDFPYGDASFIDDDEGDDCATFNDQGRLDTSSVGGTTLVFGVCSESGETEGSRAIVVSATGRAQNNKNMGAVDCS